MENTIFVNFRARDTLMAETDSYMENYMSVCPCPLLILALLDISEFYVEVGKTGAMQLMAEEMARRYSSAHCSTEMIKIEIQTSITVLGT